VLEAKQNQCHKLVLLRTNSLRTVGTAAKQQGPPEYICPWKQAKHQTYQTYYGTHVHIWISLLPKLNHGYKVDNGQILKDSRTQCSLLPTKTQITSNTMQFNGGCKNSGVLFDLCPSLGGPAWIRPTRSDSLSAHISVAASFLLHILGEAGYSWGTIWPYVVSRSLRLWAIIWPHKGALWVPCELETKVTKALQPSSTLSHSLSLSVI